LPIAGVIFVVVQQRIMKREPASARPHVAYGPGRRILPELAFVPESIVSPLARAAIQPAVSEKLETARARKPAPAVSRKTAPTPKSPQSEERVMLFGLVGLFAIMGLFIAVVLYMAAGSFHPGG